MTEEWNDLVRERMRKADEVRRRGRNPYTNDQQVGGTTADAIRAAEGKDLEKEEIRVDIAGRVVAARNFGKAAFLVIADRAGKLQVYLKRDRIGEEEYTLFRETMDIGDIVWVEGPLFLTRTGELTIQAERLRLLTKSLRPLPEKWHGLSDVETRYRQRYVDLIVNDGVRDLFRRRSLFDHQSRVIGKPIVF